MVTQAAPITYQFTASVTFESRGLASGPFTSVADSSDRIFADGTLITGQFTYDPSATGSAFGTSGTIFPAISALNGNAGGNLFSDPTGGVLIAPDATDLDPDPFGEDLRDLFQIIASDGSADFSGFTVNNGSSDFALSLFNLFFIEGGTPYAPYASGLPATRPPPTPEAARLRLTFDDLGATDTLQLVFAQPVSLTVVPLPPTFALLASGLALLGWLRRRTLG